MKPCEGESKTATALGDAPRVCRLATTSLVMGVLGLVYPFVLFHMLAIVMERFVYHLPGIGPVSELLMYLLAYLTPAFILGAVVLGILALVRISVSRGHLVGWPRACLGIYLSVIAVGLLPESILLPFLPCG